MSEIIFNPLTGKFEEVKKDREDECTNACTTCESSLSSLESKVKDDYKAPKENESYLLKIKDFLKKYYH
jgi:hypothetical protein